MDFLLTSCPGWLEASSCSLASRSSCSVTVAPSLPALATRGAPPSGESPGEVGEVGGEGKWRFSR